MASSQTEQLLFAFFFFFRVVLGGLVAIIRTQTRRLPLQRQDGGSEGPGGRSGKTSALLLAPAEEHRGKLSCGLYLESW